MPTGRLFTVGHGTRAANELVGVLHDAGVARLVDVRRYPGSRRNPQFGRDALAETLDAAGIAYDWQGETLGGRRSGRDGSRHRAWRNAAFRAALDALLASAAEKPTAAMCAETLWWRCHRRLIADAATVRGFDVVHLGAGPPALHVLHPDARLDLEGTLVYDGGRART